MNEGILQKSFSDKPFISIVTVVYNGERFLEAAIESVITQSYDNVEYIVVDGASTDKTIDIIKKYQGQIDYWVSEPDEGQSDAIIKAFSISKGDWLTWLNGDDILLPETISELVDEIKKNPDIQCFIGNVIWTTADNKIIKCRKGEKWNNLLPKFGYLHVYGPSTFFKKKLYKEVEGINKNLHYKMDTDLWWQFYYANAKFKRLKTYTWALRLHENAKMSAHNFTNSEYSDLSHHSWEDKRKETIFIENKYKNHISKLVLMIGKIYLLFNRLLSLNYIKSLYHSKIYAGQDLKNIFLMRK